MVTAHGRRAGRPAAPPGPTVEARYAARRRARACDRGRRALTSTLLGGDSSVVVGFGKRLGDAEIAALATRHGVRPSAAYMSVGGLSGTYRTDEELDPRAFLEEARTDAIESFENGLSANLVRLERFATEYTADDVAADRSLAEQARGYLRIRRQLANALRAARRGEALAFAVEVVGRGRNSPRSNAIPASGTW